MTEKEQSQHLEVLKKLVEKKIIYSQRMFSRSMELDLSHCNLGALSEKQLGELFNHIKSILPADNQTSGFHLNLSNNNLSVLPPEISNWELLTALTLDNNSLTEIPFIESKQSEFWYLSARNNQLKKVGNYNSSNEINKIRCLYLGGNQLDTWPETKAIGIELNDEAKTRIVYDIFPNLPNLTVLDLSDNLYKSFPKSPQGQQIYDQGSIRMLNQPFPSDPLSFLYKEGKNVNGTDGDDVLHKQYRSNYMTPYYRPVLCHLAEHLRAVYLIGNDPQLNIDEFRMLQNYSPMSPTWNSTSTFFREGRTPEAWEDPMVLQNLAIPRLIQGAATLGKIVPDWETLLDKKKERKFKVNVSREKIKVEAERSKHTIDILKEDLLASKGVLEGTEVEANIDSYLNLLEENLKFRLKDTSQKAIEIVISVLIEVSNNIDSDSKSSVLEAFEDDQVRQMMESVEPGSYERILLPIKESFLVNLNKDVPDNFIEEDSQLYIPRFKHHVNMAILQLRDEHRNLNIDNIMTPPLELLLAEAELFEIELNEHIKDFESQLQVTEGNDTTQKEAIQNSLDATQELLVQHQLHMNTCILPILSRKMERQLEIILEEIDTRSHLQSMGIQYPPIMDFKSVSDMIHGILIKYQELSESSTSFSQREHQIVTEQMHNLLNEIKDKLASEESLQLEKESAEMLLVAQRLDDLIQNRGTDMGNEVSNTHQGLLVPGTIRSNVSGNGADTGRFITKPPTIRSTTSSPSRRK